jgi:flavin-dependent dehydrogenase
MTADVVVLGAGPAGCTAALRLLALGHRVAVVERQQAARTGVCESLSPGIANLLHFLGLGDIFSELPCLTNVPARIAWERPEPELVASPPHVVVDRAAFGARLRGEVLARGGQVFRPFDVRHIDGEPGRWRIPVCDLTARLVLDARGRGGPARTRTPTGPNTLGLCAHTSETRQPTETHLEATAGGWLWGAPLPGGGTRLLAFVDPEAVKGRRVEDVFRELLGGSRLFAWVRGPLASPVRSCPATPYLDPEAWRPGVMKVGDTALALDPLSSSGVERAMRLALQAAIAANTLLCDPDSGELVREFYESSLVTAAATHAVWTRDAYARAWPGERHSFWRDRARPAFEGNRRESGLIARFWETCRAERGRESAAASDTPAPADVLECRVRVSASVRVAPMACAVGDRVESRPGVTHPALSRPLVFLAGAEVAPLLRLVADARSVGHLVSLWSALMPAEEAARAVGWLRLRGLLETPS